MRFLIFLTLFFTVISVAPQKSAALDLFGKNKKHDAKSAQIVPPNTLAPHKALYKISLVSTHSGSQVVNISGDMFYEWKPVCEAWVTDHRFNLFYEYADTPSMRITSDFATYETFDGSSLNFSARRKRDSTLYQEFRGKAKIADKGGVAEYTIPNDLSFELSKGALFPIRHTIELINNAKANKKFFNAVVFDGSDDEGPVEINSFIGNPVKLSDRIKINDNMDKTLLESPARQVRMAVFPLIKDEEHADYEMGMIFHENGIISDMRVDYKDFSVTQKLVALEPVKPESCTKKSESLPPKTEKKP